MVALAVAMRSALGFTKKVPEGWLLTFVVGFVKSKSPKMVEGQY